MGERVNTGPRLTLKQRSLLLDWIAEDPPLGYAEIKQRFVAHGMPVVKRQAVHYYLVRHRKQLLATAETCPTCGHKLVHPDAPV